MDLYNMPKEQQYRNRVRVGIMTMLVTITTTILNKKKKKKSNNSNNIKHNNGCYFEGNEMMEELLKFLKIQL